MIRDQFLLGMDNEIIVDLFAGGGGMSTAIEQALGRHVDIAINHDMDAISMHMANHPQTEHYCADVFEVDPREAVKSRAVGHLHGSPDCTHHSQAAGGQPRSKKIRGLGWVLPRWAGQVSPRSISMENVKQMQQWGPLIAKRDRATGRVLRLNGTVAGPGERVPVQEQYLIPDPRHAGRTWRRFIRTFEQMGYTVEWRILVAADYGAATTRERLFLFARRDGRPIVWPEPTHHRNPTRRQKAWRPAADHIDWSIPCQSIFERKRPLADATMRRIAKGMKRFVLDSADPFIVPIANWSGESVQSAAEPLRTITAYPKGGAFAVAAPTLVQLGYGERPGQAPRALDLQRPLGTVVAGGVKHALATAVLVGAGGPVYSGKPQSPGDPIGTLLTENHRALSTAYLMQANGGFNTTPGHDLRKPASTITNTGSQQQLIAANLVTLRNNCDGRAASEPLPTLSAGGEHHGIVQYTLSQEHEAGALRCAAFLISYYGNDGMRDPREPMPTATTHDRMALVTVWIQGEPWVVVDIGLRMLTPPELYGCQGFPAGYVIDHGHDGRAFTKSAQVRMVGNSVSPPPATALLRANCADLMAWSRTELRERERIAA